MSDTSGEADGSEEESTRVGLTLGDSPSELEYVPSLNDPSEAVEPKGESFRVELPLGDFPLRPLTRRLRKGDTH